MTATLTAPTTDSLWQDHYGEVVRYLRGRCSCPELANDLASETFVAAARSLGEGRNVTAAWLMTVAKRRLMDHWRRTYRDRELRAQLELRRFDPRACDPAQFIPGDALTALETLCQSQRYALTLRYLDGYSVQQVADMLGLSYRATESVLARGRRSIAAAFTAVTVAEVHAVPSTNDRRISHRLSDTTRSERASSLRSMEGQS